MAMKKYVYDNINFIENENSFTKKFYFKFRDIVKYIIDIFDENEPINKGYKNALYLSNNKYDNIKRETIRVYIYRLCNITKEILTKHQKYDNSAKAFILNVKNIVNSYCFNRGKYDVALPEEYEIIDRKISNVFLENDVFDIENKIVGIFGKPYSKKDDLINVIDSFKNNKHNTKNKKISICLKIKNKAGKIYDIYICCKSDDENISFNYIIKDGMIKFNGTFDLSKKINGNDLIVYNLFLKTIDNINILEVNGFQDEIDEKFFIFNLMSLIKNNNIIVIKNIEAGIYEPNLINMIKKILNKEFSQIIFSTSFFTLAEYINDGNNIYIVDKNNNLKKQKISVNCNARKKILEKLIRE